MAKGLRSKTKRKNRAIKRIEVFAPVESKRTERLAEKLATLQEQDGDCSMQETKEQTKVEQQDVDMEQEKLSRIEKDKLFLSRNQFKRKQVAKMRSKSRARR